MVHEGKDFSDQEDKQELPEWIRKLQELLKKVNEEFLEKDQAP